MIIKKNVMIVEDHQSTRETLKCILECDERLNVFAVSNGFAAFNCLKNDDINVAIIDLNLPGDVQGTDILRKIKSESRYKHIECIIMSHQNDSRITEQCRREGAYCYISKMCEWIDTLPDHIGNALKKQEQFFEIIRLKAIIQSFERV